MRRWTITGYANQVRLFLFLVVLFLVMQGALNFSLLFAARDALAGAARARLAEAARRAAVEIQEAAPAGEPPAGLLAALARRLRIADACLMHPGGEVVACSSGVEPGVPDRDAAGLSDAERRALAGGREAFRLEIPWNGPARLVIVQPLLDPDGSLRGLLKVVDAPADLADLVRRIRVFALLQAAGAAAVLALTFAFIRWLLRPYRLLVRTAAAALPAPASEDGAIQAPSELIGAVQGVLDKLRHHERDARALGGTALGGPDIRGLPSGLVATDAAGAVTALNPAAARLLQVEEAGALGRPFREVLAASPDLAALVQDCLERGAARSRVVVRAAAAGGASHLGATVAPIGADPGPRAGALCLFSDLTEIRALEEKGRQRESLAELGQLSAGIAHEVRNAFATVLGYAKLLARGSEGEARDHAEAIRREVESARGILDDFLRFARPVSLNVERFPSLDLATEVTESFRDDPLAAGKHLRVEGEWPEVEGDEALLRQALINLVRNALEAVAAGGRVEVRGRQDEEAGELQIEVHDDGPGLPQGVEAGELFRPFFTTKPGGTGLGLAWVRKTVVYHDGRVEVGRGEWGGASVRMFLPLRRSG